MNNEQIDKVVFSFYPTTQIDTSDDIYYLSAGVDRKDIKNNYFNDNNIYYNNLTVKNVILDKYYSFLISNSNTFKCFLNFIFDNLNNSNIVFEKKYNKFFHIINNRFEDTELSLLNFINHYNDFFVSEKLSNYEIKSIINHINSMLVKSDIWNFILKNYSGKNEILFDDYGGGIGATPIELYLSQENINVINVFDINKQLMKYSNEILQYISSKVNEEKINNLLRNIKFNYCDISVKPQNIFKRKRNLELDNFEIINLSGILYLFNIDKRKEILISAYESITKGILVIHHKFDVKTYRFLCDLFNETNVDIVGINGFIKPELLEITNCLFKKYIHFIIKKL